MLRQQSRKDKPRKLRAGVQHRRGSLRWAASQLGISPSHLVRVRDGERPNVGNLLERFNQLKGTR